MYAYTVKLIRDVDKGKFIGYYFEVEHADVPEYDVSRFHICFEVVKRPNNLMENCWLRCWSFTVDRTDDIPYAKRMLIESRMIEMDEYVREVRALESLKEVARKEEKESKVKEACL